VTTWGKRALGIVLFTAALGVGSEIRSLATPYQDPPASVPGWSLAGPAECGKATPPDARSWRGVATARRVCRAEYDGQPPMRLTLFDLPGYPVGGGAFDAWQKWPPNQPGKIGFFTGRFFGVVESPAADHATLDRFALALGKALTGGELGGRW
jgi:hypothetical protein